MKYKLGYRGYIASRKVNVELVPHNVQNLVIGEYDKDKLPLLEEKLGVTFDEGGYSELG